jgi:hypothetical protein
MIDDLFEVTELMAQIEQNLPLKARPSKLLVTGESAIEGIRSTDKELTIGSVVYAADEAGILCNIQCEGLDKKHPLLVSITHLRFLPITPLGKAIVSYQRKRIKRLKRQR